MKHIRLYSLFLMLLTAIAATALDVNKFYIGQVSGMKSLPVDLPFYIENTCSNVTALQVDVIMPEGMTLQTNESYFTMEQSRIVDHRVKITQLNSNLYGARRYRVMLLSPQNKTLFANKGKVFSVQALVAADAPMEEGHTYPIEVQEVVISDASGNNVMTEYQNGSLTIAPSPDFTVSNVEIASINGVAGASTLKPGDNFTLNWTVNNIGTADSQGGWSEQVQFISNTTGETVLVATSRHIDQTLASGASVNLTGDFTVPRIPGLDGSCKAQIRLVPGSESGEPAEYQQNNTTASTADYTMQKQLYMSIYYNDITEPGSGRSITYSATLERSGSRVNEETFNVSLYNKLAPSTTDSRLALSESTAKFYQDKSKVYVNFTVTDNSTLDGDVAFCIAVAEANGYAATSAEGLIRDDELPQLTVSMVKTENAGGTPTGSSVSDLYEGDELTLTVATPSAVESALRVQLVNDQPTRFNMPSSVTIPAGGQSATATIKVVEDYIPADDVSVKFTASAEGYDNGNVLAILHDDDMPTLELALSSNTVSEGAGANAVVVTLRRDEAHTNAEISVQLTAEPNDIFMIPNKIIRMPRGTKAVSFSLSTIDNNQVNEPNRDVTLTAAVYYSSCSCKTNGTKGGTAQAVITVVDDDGPALTLCTKSANIKEGTTTQFTVKRNDDTTNDLLVGLCTRDSDPSVSMPTTVTIPAGESSVEFDVTLQANEVSGDSHTITFYARAAGYAQGSCWVMATDQTLPDATVDLSIVSKDVYATLPAQLSLTIHNQGYAPLPEKTAYAIVAGDKTVYTGYTPRELGYDEATEMTIQLETVLSETPGNVKVYAVINSNGQIQEVNHQNNNSETITVNVLSLLAVKSIQTNKILYSSEETVTISGETKGLVNRNANLEVYITQGGTRLTLNTVTDDEGRFQVDWTPSLGMAGRFGIGACMPGEGLTTEPTAIQLYGMRRATQTFVAHELEVNETVNGKIAIYNPGSLALQNITATVIGNADNIEVHFNTIPGLAPGEAREMTYTITGKNTSADPKNWQTLNLRITSNEGAVMLQTIYYVVYAATPVLKASVTDINTTMVKGATRTVEFTIRNEGRLETGAISIDLGNQPWLSTATPQNMASLDIGEEATVVLQMTPTADMELNSVTTGSIYLSGANGCGLSIPMRVECVSEQTGTLAVDVWDEFTANTEEAPHVSGATVAVLHPVTQKLLYQDVTGESGIVTFENLPEGQYLLRVTHPKHESYSNLVVVAPGRTLTQRVFIQYSAVTIEMTYEPTEVEDVYDIVTTMTYETRVPAPVLLMDMPDKLLVKEIQTPYIFYATLTNTGLITAKKTTFHITPQWGDYYFTPLIEGPWDILPQQSITIPVEITKLEDGISFVDAARSTQRRGKIDDDALDCALGAMARYLGDCDRIGGTMDEHKVSRMMQVNDACSRLADFVSALGQVAESLGFMPSGGGGTPGGGKPFNNGTVHSGGVACDPCLYNHAKEYMSAAQGMSGNKKEQLENGAKLVRPCEETRKYPAEAIASSRAAGVRAKVAKTVIYDFDFENMDMKTLMNLNREMLSALKGNDDPEPISIPGYSYETDALIEIPAWQPSYIKSYILNTYIANDQNYHDVGYILYVMGNPNYPLIETVEAMNLVAAFSAGTPTAEQKAALCPAALSTEQYQAVWNNLSLFTSTDFDLLASLAARVQADQMKINNAGYFTAKDLLEAEGKKLEEGLNQSDGSVCATVKLQIEQQMTMTRQAVRGTLTVVNGSELNAMTNIRLNLVVTDPDGNVANSHIMEIHTESIEGFTGQLDYESGWDLAAGQTGTAKILFIPTKYAAPTVPLQYTFAGTISFVDPFTGQELTRELETERLTVKPSPVLDLTYFMQRDIFGDDPLTDEVEPMVPAQFSLLINNKGYGDATNVKMATNQPQIVENEKGLLADFEILSSQLNGGDKTLALGASVTTNFGNIPAHSQAYAQWWMTSRFTGHFVAYDVAATHVTSYDNPDLTLLDEVTIHELIHQIKIPGSDQTPPLIGFMVNDEEDAQDTPDQLYLSDGTTQPIYLATSTQVTKRTDTEYVLEIVSGYGGWNYGKIVDPTGGARKVLSITRLGADENSNTVLPTVNFWQTDRTLRDGTDPLYENLLHFCDEMTLGGVHRYVVTFEDKPAVTLAVNSISGLPAANTFTQIPVTEVVVTFNKDINPASFTYEDLTLMHEGETVDLSAINVEPIELGNNKTFRIDLSSVTTLDGYYSLDVQTAGIYDPEGFHGETGKMSGWIQLTDGKVNLTMKVSPEGAGTITPGTTKQGYYDNVAINATANNHYTFLKWEKDGVLLSEQANYTYNMAGAATLTAVFQPKQYKLVVNYDTDGGSLEGGGTGLYDYNHQLTLKAVAKTGYYFAGWKHGNEEGFTSENETLTLTVTGADTYEAVFRPLTIAEIMLLDTNDDNVTCFGDPKSMHYKVSMNRKLSKNQWNTFCVPFDISEQQINKTWGYNTMLVRLMSVEGDELKFEYAWNIQAGKPYLIKPERTVVTPMLEYKGNLQLAAEPVPDVYGENDEYKYVGIYSPHTWTEGTEWYYGVSSGKILKAKNSTSALNGFRAYFVIPGNATARISIMGVETVGMEDVEYELLQPVKTRIYNLQGLYLGDDISRLSPGLYIVNGKKQVVK